jgi:integrase/recombinase XerD
MKKDLFQDSRIFWNTAQKFIHHYLPDIRKASNNTTASYRDGLNSYITFLEGKKGLSRSKICFSHLSEDYVKTFQDWLLNDKKVSARTSNLRLTALRSFMEYSAAEYKDLTAFYVAIHDIKDSEIPVDPIEFFEKKQMKAILAAPNVNSRTGRRNQMILILMYDTAARVAEVLEMTVGSTHLDADTPYMTIHGKGDKYRNVPLMDKTCRHLKRYLSEFHEKSAKTEPLFYAVTHGARHALSSDTMEQLIKHCARDAASKGIEMPDSCHCHMIRKTRAMDLYQADVPLTHIQQLLGHENISTTSGFYAFATLDTLKKSMQKAAIEGSETQKEWKDKKKLQKLYSL